MNVVRPSDGLLPATATIALIELIVGQSDSVSIDQILRDFTSLFPVSHSRTRNTIEKLTTYEVAIKTDDTIHANSSLSKDWFTEIGHRVALEFSEKLSETTESSCLQYNSDTGNIVIDAMTMPPMLDGLAMWVTDFEVARRPAVQARYWTVTQDYSQLMLTHVRSSNAKRPRRTKSAEQLEANLAHQAKIGKEAEDWVVKFEKRRLLGHPLSDQIRRISDDDVSAGYDIVSFLSSASLRHDLFIEVKSYSGTKLFHWSRNEIATAIELGESYALYLVDRNKCSIPEYRPHIIKRPSPELFTRPKSGWTVEATSYEHTAVDSSAHLPGPGESA